MLMDLAAEFVKQLNSAIGQLDTQNENHAGPIEKLADKISKTMKRCEASEDFINMLISKIEDSLKECRDVVYVRKDGNICAIVSRDIVKPNINTTSKLNIECTCLFAPFEKFEENKGYIIIDSEESLRKLDSMLENVILGVFDHDYRSFEGFSCFIGLYVPNGYIYIIDTVKFRDIIPQLRLLTCGVKKIICSQRDVDRLVKDFGSIGCYQNFNVPDSNVYIDWRIRPLNEVLCCIICSELINAVEKHNLGMAHERHQMQPTNEMNDFMNFYGVHASFRNVAEDLMKLRVYLAKKNDESLQYVMTDIQLYQLILNMPSNVDEFEFLLNRMSSILRLHVGDVLLILNQKSRMFSLESLKSKNTESCEVLSTSRGNLLEDRHCLFDSDREEACVDEDGTLFEISD
ncbi:uncharacterized protein VICG_00211 [Vittaforma corneae ATCC 50505]|uniref:HRDC domain-containing protein n=1 Tax=Vittaforma corneae (strain ATCC 50505) TaxID=993615 RepID=L2GPY0_VITCO|nr:uncharacterized protein VICG_00211 [Vittaforma corneae ATCC 50505]ELA42896.1 hypothetical protein VICG_00211 [Vittaforma corneae ATCC 50505]